MTRARSNVDVIETDVALTLQRVRAALAPADHSPLDVDLTTLETYFAIAMRVFRKTNPSKLASETKTVEIHQRMDGRPVINEEGQTV